LSRPVDIEELRELLEKEIEELERRLQLYQQLLSLLDECEAALAGALRGRGKEFRDPEGRVVAVMVTSRDKVTLAFHRPVSESNPYIKYVIRTMKRLAEEGEGIEYSIDKDETGRVRKITVLGVTKDNVDDVVATLEYAAMKIAQRTRQS
jgi:hypothetical protein